MTAEVAEVRGTHPAFLLEEDLILTHLPTGPQTTLPSPLQPLTPFLAMTQVLWARLMSHYG